MATHGVSAGIRGLAAILWLVSRAAAEVPIEGPRELIDVMLAAQKRNTAQYERGLIEADVEIIQHYDKLTRQFANDPPEVFVDIDGKTTSKVTVVWNRLGTYWKFDSKEQLGEHDPREYRGEIIQRGDQAMTYRPDSNLVVIAAAKQTQIHDELKIRPLELWFTINGRYPLSSWIDPTVLPDLLSKHVVRENDNGLIEAERHYKIGGYYHWQVAPAQNGNVISYGTVQDDAPGPWYRGEFDWQELPSGGWYVKQLVMEQSIKGSPKLIDRKLTVNVTRFDPSPEIAANRFSLDSLKLPAGTRVDEYEPGQNQPQTSYIRDDADEP